MPGHFEQGNPRVQPGHRARPFEFFATRVQAQVRHPPISEGVQEAEVFLGNPPGAAVQRPRHQQCVVVNQVEERHRNAIAGPAPGPGLSAKGP